LRRDAEIAPIVPNLKITANNGAVILSGSVQSEEQKRQIEAIAQQATGVRAINNQLHIITSPAYRENPSSNPPLNPTSNNGDKSPRLYKNAPGSTDNSGTNALNQTSRPEGSDRLYQNAGSTTQNSNSNALNGQEQNGQPQTTNSNPNKNTSQMPRD
jgi:hypothetical protein